eukprot:gene14566-16721_t
MIQPSNRSRTSKAAQQQSHSSSGKLRTSTDQQSQSSNQGAADRPRRQSAVRAEQLLQNLYSEYDRSDRQNKETVNDDDSYHSNSSHNGSGSGSNTDSDQTIEQRGPEEDTAARTSKGSNEFYWIDDSEETPAPRAASRHSSRGNKKTKSSDHSKQSKHSSRSSASHRSRGSPVTDNASPDQPRRQSSRAASLSSKKEKDYLHAQQALRAASCLQSVLLSSSGESESESEHNDTRRLSRQQQYSSDEDRPTSSYKNNTKSSNKKSPKTSYSFSMSQARSPAKKAVGLMYRNDERDEREEDYSDRTESDINDFIVNSDEERAEEEQREEELRLLREQKKAAKKRNHQEDRRNKQSKSSSHTGKNAADVIRRATEQYNKGVSDGINLNHPDESEEDEMQVSRHHNNHSSASKRDASNSMGGANSAGGRKRKVIHDSSDDENENDQPGEASAEEGEQGYMEIVAPKKPTNKNNYDANAQATTSSSATRNKITTFNATASTSNRKQNRPMKDFIASDSERSERSQGENNHDNNNNGSDNSDSDTGGSSGDSSSEQNSAESEVDASDLDGPMLYYKVNSMRDKREDKGDFANLANMRKRFSIPEAMQYYVELLAHTLIDPHYLQECHNPGNTRRPKHSTHQQRQDQRQLTLQKSNYLSATRQLENSICTNRESLIGSGAWNKEFYAELQSRPFYSSGPTLLCHDSRSGFGISDGDDQYEQMDWDKVKCAACNRSTQRPDLQVYLFGSTYDAGKVWNSTKWDQHLPTEMFLYKEEEVADEDYQHHPLSNSNNPSTTNSASKHNPLYSSSNHSSAQKARKNKQFQGYQTIMNSNIGTYGGKYTIDKKNNIASATNNTNTTHSNTNNNGTTSSIKKSTLRPDEDMVTTIHNRKRRIVLSDNEGDSGAENELGSEVKVVSGGSGHKRRRANSEEFEDGTTATMIDLTQDDNMDEQEQDRDMGNESSDLEVVPSADDIYTAQQAQHQLEEQELTRAWWKQKFPKELTREKESVFYLSAHCKSRTRLYHTLLHYKFRLLLNIREKIQDIANRMCGEQQPGSPGFPGSSTSSSGQKRTVAISSKYHQFDTSWEDWEPQERRYLLEAAVEELKQDTVFVDNEARRFQTLIKETERRFGGREEPPRDIWGDEDHHGSHPSFTAHRNNGAAGGSTSSSNRVSSHGKGGSGSSVRRPMSQQTKTMVGWLTKQKLSVQSYSFDVGKHEFIVPEGVTTLSVTLSGASGGNANNAVNGMLARGGQGGIISADISVVPGELLLVYVGGAGTENGEGGESTANGGSAGLPNGENGKQGSYANGNPAGGGGTQDTGGQPGYYCNGGDFGQGANCCNYYGAGGGGGYFGGGGAHAAAGGGGSSFAADGYKSSGVAFPAGNGTATLTWFPATALSIEFNDKGHHEFTVPIGVTTLSVLLSGASGGDSFSTDYQVHALGGRGGLIRADIQVEPGEVLRIFVGGAGVDMGEGGYNGGGGGGTQRAGGHPGTDCYGGYLGQGATCCNYYGAAGGGGYYGGGGAYAAAGGGGSSYAAEGYISSGVAFPAGDGRATLSWAPSAIKSVTFSNEGVYDFNVPDTVTTLFAVLSGASGGSSINTYTQMMVIGGFGGLISAEIQVLPTETLRIIVGGAGSENGIGGFNGG